MSSELGMKWDKFSMQNCSWVGRAHSVIQLEVTLYFSYDPNISTVVCSGEL